MYSQTELEKIVKDALYAGLESGEINLAPFIVDALPEADFSNIDLVVKTLTANSLNIGGFTDFVKIIEAPESTTLTDDEISSIIKGVFVNGAFLGYTNPVFFPALDSALNNTYTGYAFGCTATHMHLFKYVIDKSSKVISVATNAILSMDTYGNLTINQAGGGQLSIASATTGTVNFRNKAIPVYPANTGTFVLKCVDGVLTWVAE